MVGRKRKKVGLCFYKLLVCFYKVRPFFRAFLFQKNGRPKAAVFGADFSLDGGSVLSRVFYIEAENSYLFHRLVGGGGEKGMRRWKEDSKIFASKQLPQLASSGKDESFVGFEDEALGLEIGQNAGEGGTLNAEGLRSKLHTRHHAALANEIEDAGAEALEGEGAEFATEEGAAVGDVLHKALHRRRMLEQEGEKGVFIDDPNLAIGDRKNAHGETALAGKQKGGGQNDRGFEEIDGEVFVFLFHLGACGAARKDIDGTARIALTDDARILFEMLATMGNIRQPFGHLRLGATRKKRKFVEHN